MRLLLMRHGQTDLNVQKRLQGSTDIPLNEVGREQAKKTGVALKEQGIQITKVISSPLGRAMETGHLVSGIPMEEIEVAPELIEMCFGVLETQIVEEVAPEFMDCFFEHPETYIPPDGGESYEDAMERVGILIEKLRSRMVAEEWKKEDVVLLVSHGATSHGIFSYLAKAERSAYWDVDFNNCAIVEIFLSEDGKKDTYEFLTKGFQKNW